MTKLLTAIIIWLEAKKIGISISWSVRFSGQEHSEYFQVVLGDAFCLLSVIFRALAACDVFLAAIACASKPKTQKSLVHIYCNPFLQNHTI